MPEKRHTYDEIDPTPAKLTRAIEQLEAQNREMRQDREHIARALIDEHRKRENAQHFLNNVGVVLAGSLDYKTTLSSIVRVAVPYLADSASVDIVGPDRVIRRVAVFHKIPGREQLLWELDRFAEPDAAFGRAKVMRTGRPDLYSCMTPDLEMAIASNSEHLQLLRRLRCTSYMCVPLKTRGNTIGAISLMREAGSEPYTSSDLALAENLADRAALALDNAWLYKREQEASRLKDEFLATVSHELRTPLTPILGAVYMLRERCGNHPEVATAAEVIERNAKRQARIVEALFDLSKIAKGVFVCSKEPTDFAGIVETTVELVRPAANRLGIEIQMDIERPDRPVFCDPDRIQQAISNLLSNSMKFTPSGGRISVRLWKKNNGVGLSVADSGEGIPPEFLPKVFERFRQADRFNTRGYGGLGVGLSIVRHIVEKHGGSVHAESPGAGHGAVFTIELPY